VITIRKKCPQCGSKAVKLYQNKSFEGRRAWIPIAWHCIKCGYTYKVASDTLIYKTADEPYKDSFKEKCPKCTLGLVRLYRHVNPKYGKQYWVSMGWYCTRCKYVWMDKKTEKDKD
jgi:transposase-like protein